VIEKDDQIKCLGFFSTIPFNETNVNQEKCKVMFMYCLES